jgi:hypothetical protein
LKVTFFVKVMLPPASPSTVTLSAVKIRISSTIT